MTFVEPTWTIFDWKENRYREMTASEIKSMPAPEPHTRTLLWAFYVERVVDG